MTEKQRATLRYSSQVDMNYKGDYKVAGITVGDFSTKIRYPNKVGLGYGIQLTDTIQIEGLVEWLEWSVNDTVTSDAAGTRLEQENDWDDTFTAGIGASWSASDAWVFRAGYSFIESPVPKSTISPILPDADRQNAHWIIAATAHAAKFDEIVEPLVGAAIPVPDELARILEWPSSFATIEPTIEEITARL